MQANYISSLTPERNSVVLSAYHLFGMTTGTVTMSVSIPEGTELETFAENGHLFINGAPYVADGNKQKSITSDVYPYLFTIRLDSNVDVFPEGDMDVVFTGGQSGDHIVRICVSLSDTREIQDYGLTGVRIDTSMSSYMLMRTNPRLTGNIKLVIDSEGKLYLDTFKVSDTLNDRVYRKYPVSSDGNYPFDVKTVFSRLPRSEMFRLPKDSLNPHKFYTSYDDQYITDYEYGAETSTDDMYPENMRLLAPLHLGKDIPDFFCIFRYEGVMNEESYTPNTYDDADKLRNLIRTSEVVRLFDLRKYTAAGQYLRNYHSMISDFLYGSCYMQFIEQENAEDILNIRQGMDSWKGIDISRGVITSMIESSYFKTSVIDKDDAVQERFNNYVLGGYERNNVLYPYILNIEFMFNDDPELDEFSMHRYFGLYLTENALVDYDSIIRFHDSGEIIKTAPDGSQADDRRAIAAASESALGDRIFFITTNNDAARIQSQSDVDEFVSKYVLNNPDKHIGNLRAVKHEWSDDEKSFISMKFTGNISYGEHFRIIARNLSENGSLKNICIDLIASNDGRLRLTDDNISAYIQTSKLETHQDMKGEEVVPTETYRVSFYTQSLTDETVSAELPVQIGRLAAAIRKCCSFASVEMTSSDKLGLVSSHTDVWFQHIAAPNHVKIPDFGYMAIDGNEIKFGGRLEKDSKTIRKIEKALDDFTGRMFTPKYVDDVRFHDGCVTAPADKIDTERTVAYAEYESEDSVTDDYIRYYNQDFVTKMHILSPDTWWYSPEFVAFSLGGFETLGWRYSSLVRFMETAVSETAYDIYDSVVELFGNIRYPLVKATDGNFYPVPDFEIGQTYLTDNTLLLLSDDAYHVHTQELVTVNKIVHYVMSPSNPDATLLRFSSSSDVNKFLPVTHNYQMSVYNPEAARISIMGITQFRDFDMYIGDDREQEVTSSGSIVIPSGTTLQADSQEDDRLKRNVLYEIEAGGTFNRYAMRRFIIVGDTRYYVVSDSDTEIQSADFSGSLTATTDVIMKVFTDEESIFSFISVIPGQKADNFFKEPGDSDNSQLSISVVPQSNCLWISNGVYLDRNSVLDVSCMKNAYEPEGFFTEHGFSLNEDGRTSSYSLDSYALTGSDIRKFRDIIDKRSVSQAIRKMLVSNTQIQTAVGYYNPFVQSLEFIYYGIKFNIKFNADYYNQNIRIGDYNNFDVYIINDYDPQKENEIYISTTEEMILIVNHQFDNSGTVNSQASMIYDVSDGNLTGGCGYKVDIAPYRIYADSICGFSDSMCCRRESTSEKNDASTWFVQEDYRNDEFSGNSKVLPHYVYFPADATDEDNTIVNVAGSSVGILRDDSSGHYSTVKYSDMQSLQRSGHNLTSYIHRQQDSFIVGETTASDTSVAPDGSEALDEYMESMSGNFKCYIISHDSTEEFLITDEYKPIILMMSRPKRIKYNFGYFIPRTYAITKFAVDDYEVADRCGISLFLSGTKLEKVERLNSYTGNMVIPETATGPITRNYFIMDGRSVMMSNWDAKYYRTYSQDGSFKYIDGYVPGIEDKSFIGSRCMIIKSDYILLDDFSSVRVSARTECVSSDYNTQSKNVIQRRITINISQAIYDLFEKSQVFRDNWSTISGDVQTSISNYIKNSISKIYNRQRKRDVEILSIRDPELDYMDVVFNSPMDETDWENIDDYDAEMTVSQNDEMVLVITMTERPGTKVHPRVKIYRHF